jgi:hypothetical protein
MDRLTQGNTVRDPSHLVAGALGIFGALVAVVLKALGTFLGTVD